MFDTVQEIAIYIHRFHNLDLFQQGWYQIKISMRWENDDYTSYGTPSRVVQYESPDLGSDMVGGIWRIDDKDNSFLTQPFRIRYARQDVRLSIMISFSLPLGKHKSPPTYAVIVKFELLQAPTIEERKCLAGMCATDDDLVTYSMDSDARKSAMTKLNSARSKVDEIAAVKSKLTAENTKMKESIVQLKNRVKDFKPELVAMDVKNLEEEYQALVSDKAEELEYLNSLQQQIKSLRIFLTRLDATVEWNTRLQWIFVLDKENGQDPLNPLEGTGADLDTRMITYAGNSATLDGTGSVNLVKWMVGDKALVRSGWYPFSFIIWGSELS